MEVQSYTGYLSEAQVYITRSFVADWLRSPPTSYCPIFHRTEQPLDYDFDRFLDHYGFPDTRSDVALCAFSDLHNIAVQIHGSRAARFKERFEHRLRERGGPTPVHIPDYDHDRALKNWKQVEAYRHNCRAEGRPVNQEVIEDITFQDYYDVYGID